MLLRGTLQLMVRELLAMLNLQPWKQRLQHFQTYRWAFLRQILVVMQVAQVCVLLVVMILVQVVPVVPDALDAGPAVQAALDAGTVVLVAAVVAAVIAAVVAPIIAAVVANKAVPEAAAPPVPDVLALVAVHVGVRRQAVGRVVHFVPQCVKVQVQTKKEE